MTEAAWLEMAPKMAKGIRAMPIVRKNPEWWCLKVLDGFEAHTSSRDANAIYRGAKIMIMKEEGDASHVIQAYDQEVGNSIRCTPRIHLGCTSALSSTAPTHLPPMRWRRQTRRACAQRSVLCASHRHTQSTSLTAGSSSTLVWRVYASLSRRFGFPLSKRSTCTHTTVLTFLHGASASHTSCKVEKVLRRKRRWMTTTRCFQRSGMGCCPPRRSL